MEKSGACRKDTVMIELTRGRDYANQLKKELNPTLASCGYLLERVLSSYDNALSLVNCMPLLRNGDARSEGSDPDSKGQVHNNGSKKRKALARWSEQMRVCTETGFEGKLDDGYYWRKYGQKDILGAKHPRAYYRCTHRSTQGCLATKQVQRTDKDPSIFEVIYRGKHTCIQEMRKKKKENLDVRKRLEDKEDEICPGHTNMTCKPENQEMFIKDDNFPTVTFSSTPIGCDNVETWSISGPKNFVGTSNSPAFLSPETSESYLLLSPCQINDIELTDILQSSESDFAEINLNPTPSEDFPSGELGFLMDQIEFDSCFIDPSYYF